jgi:hypothetical protein
VPGGRAAILVVIFSIFDVPLRKLKDRGVKGGAERRLRLDWGSADSRGEVVVIIVLRKRKQG